MAKTRVTYKRPWLYEKQTNALFSEKRYAVVEASTKSGKTVGCMAWITEQAFRGQYGWQYWWIAPTYRQTEIAYRRLKRGLSREVFSSNDSRLQITLINGAQIVFLSGEKPDNLYGEDVYAAVIDEASRIREEAWHAIRSTLTATKGPVRIIGNVKGRKNWFYKMARRAEGGEPEMHYARLTWEDAVEAEILDREEVEDARRQLPDKIFDELYAAHASDDEGNPFGINDIRACVSPISHAPAIAWGWDLAKKQDWTVGVGIDKAGQVCRFVRFQKPWEDTIRAIITATAGVAALVDSTGVGDPIVERLQREGGSNFEGFLFSSPSKQKIMEGLAVSIQSREITVLEGPMQNELESFEYVYTRTGVRYSAPEGMHDDCVCGLALAVEKARHPTYTWAVVDSTAEEPEETGDNFYPIGTL